MCEKNSKGPNNIDPEQVDIPGTPPIPQVVVGWNKERCRRRCSICHKTKTFRRGPVFKDANNKDANDKLKLVCSRCAEHRVDDGLLALLKLAEAKPTQVFHAFLKKYLAAVEPREQT